MARKLLIGGPDVPPDLVPRTWTDGSKVPDELHPEGSTIMTNHLAALMFLLAGSTACSDAEGTGAGGGGAPGAESTSSTGTTTSNATTASSGGAGGVGGPGGDGGDGGEGGQGGAGEGGAPPEGLACGGATCRAGDICVTRAAGENVDSTCEALPEACVGVVDACDRIVEDDAPCEGLCSCEADPEAPLCACQEALRARCVGASLGTGVESCTGDDTTDEGLRLGCKNAL